MTATDTQKQMAFTAALYALHERPRVIHLRAANNVILVTLAMPGGTVELVRAITADQPEFDSLAERDRSRIRSAFLALAQIGGARDGNP